MKKFKRYLIAVTFLVSLLCLALGLVACESGPEVAELRVENARVNFMRGDEFETGEDFSVIAVFEDGTEKDVTSEASVRQESGMDMNVPGNYQITVSYGKKREIYTVYVNDSEDVLIKIELDSSQVKKNYELGDSVSLDGLVLHLTYENSQGVSFPVETTSLKGFAVEIKGEDGVAIGSVFSSLGKFTVTVSKGSVKASFDVNVAGINISTVQGAITVGGFYQNRVASGDAIEKEEMASNGLKESFHYQYAFGDRYTRFSEVHEQPVNTYHCSVDDEGIFIVRQEDGKIVTNNMSHPDMINGSPFILWYYKDTVYGIEGVLRNLYERAKECTNDDLVETVDEAAREYSFSFSGLEQSTNSQDYFETSVTFTLSEDYTIATVEYTQKYYEDNSAWAEGERTFVTDPATGKTVPVSERPSHRRITTVSQTTGERTEKNQYSRDMFDIKSFDLIYNGQKLENELKCDVATGTYLITIDNVLPATATFAQDILYLDYEGNRTGAAAWLLSNEHFTVTKSESEITLTVRHGGKWTLIFQTAKVTKKLTIDVKGENPTSIEAQLWNVANGNFYSGESKIAAINGEIYFYGAVNDYANAEQTAKVTSGNSEAVTLVQTEIGEIPCFKFSASATGTYKVTVTSTASPSLSCTFTFTVSDEVDFSALLNGDYTAKDTVGNIYRVTFHRTDEGALIKGTVTVTRTPTDESDVPIESETVSQTLAFYVDDMEITVEHGNNDKLWIEFAVNEENELLLVDQRMLRYKLVRVSS